MPRKPTTPQPPGLSIRPGLSIPEAELRVRRTRSGGPGGQNVNKVSTRIELMFDVRHSEALSEAQKERILERLATRIDKRGVLRVVAQAERTQARNEALARARLADLLREALRQRRVRRPTKPTRAAAERRLQGKRKRSAVKGARRRPRPDES